MSRPASAMRNAPNSARSIGQEKWTPLFRPAVRPKISGIEPNRIGTRNRTMKPIIVWFRQDLRLSDNPALTFAAKSGQPVVCLYVLDDETPGEWKMGGASRWWLHHSLAALDKSLKGHLCIRRGNGASVIKALAMEAGAETVTWNRGYEPFAIERDRMLKIALASQGVTVKSFNGALLHEPWELKTAAGTPFRVFTPFWKALREREVGKPRPAPRHLHFHKVPPGDR